MNEKDIKTRIEELQQAYIEMSNLSKEEDKLHIKKQKAQHRLVMARDAMRDIKFTY